MEIVRERGCRRALRVAGKILLLLLVLWGMFGVVFGVWRVEGVGMGERVMDGDLVLFLRVGKDYKVGDVVIFEHEGKRGVSEVVAAAGAVVTVDEEGYIVVDGERETEAPAYDIAGGESPKMSAPFLVPEGGYFVLNRNLDMREDSREYGAVMEKEILGKAIGLLRTRAI